MCDPNNCDRCRYSDVVRYVQEVLVLVNSSVPNPTYRHDDMTLSHGKYNYRLYVYKHPDVRSHL